MEQALRGQLNDRRMYPNFVAIATALGADAETVGQRVREIAEAEHPDDTPNMAALYLRVLAEVVQS